MSNINYWLVGAALGGVDHQDDNFIENNIWFLGWSKHDKKSLYNKACKIKKGDRIAIKKMKGQGAKDIQICHIGIIKGVVDYTDKVICVVDWLVKEKNISVESKGCFKSIHGPYTKDKKHKTWLNEIFSL